MSALRSLVRSTPRSFFRLPVRAARPQLSHVRSPAVARMAWTPPAARAALFHSSSMWKQEFDSQELVAKLQSEIAVEEEVIVERRESSNLEEFLESSEFQVLDTPGMHEVALKRKFGDETIRVIFSVVDLSESTDTGDDIGEEQALSDEDLDSPNAQSGGANTKGSVMQGKMADGNIQSARESDELMDNAEDEDMPDFPIRTSIIIERPGKGAMRVETTVLEGVFNIEEILHFHEARLADGNSAEDERYRRRLYNGPPFSNLDQDVQDLMDKYLRERGIDTRLALFIPEYIDLKEQKEYIRWLRNIRRFVE